MRIYTCDKCGDIVQYRKSANNWDQYQCPSCGNNVAYHEDEPKETAVIAPYGWEIVKHAPDWLDLPEDSRVVLKYLYQQDRPILFEARSEQTALAPLVNLMLIEAKSEADSSGHSKYQITSIGKQFVVNPVNKIIEKIHLGSDIQSSHRS